MVAMSERLTTAQQIGRQVRKVLVEQGRTQNDLAAVLGLTHGSLSRRTLGQVSFKADELVDIANFLGVEPARFLQPIPEPRARAEPLEDPPAPLATAGGRGAA
jgi:transcriptional regulator with XRE-family HTH domain